LIIALKEQITLLGKINAKLEEENQSLKDQLKKVQ
jgi:hypothetical protein